VFPHLTERPTLVLDTWSFLGLNTALYFHLNYWPYSPLKKYCTHPCQMIYNQEIHHPNSTNKNYNFLIILVKAIATDVDCINLEMFCVEDHLRALLLRKYCLCFYQDVLAKQTKEFISLSMLLNSHSSYKKRLIKASFLLLGCVVSMFDSLGVSLHCHFYSQSCQLCLGPCLSDQQHHQHIQ